MKRRNLVAGLGSVAALAAGGYVATGGLGPASGNTLEPVTIEPLAVPSSPEEPFSVPFEGQVTVIDLFATWCKPCIEHMDTLQATKAAVADSVRFVSVTNQKLGGDLTEADIQDWWEEHGGGWPAGFDQEGNLTRRTDSRGVPHTVVVDESGHIAWARTGTVGNDEIVAAIESVTEG